MRNGQATIWRGERFTEKYTRLIAELGECFGGGERLIALLRKPFGGVDAAG